MSLQTSGVSVLDMSDDEWARKVEQFLAPPRSNADLDIVALSATGIAVATLAVAIAVQLLALFNPLFCLPAAAVMLLVLRRVWALRAGLA
jgi:hypothetical protein